MVRKVIEGLLVDLRDLGVLLAPPIRTLLINIKTFFQDDLVQMFGIFIILYLVVVLL